MTCPMLISVQRKNPICFSLMEMVPFRLLFGYTVGVGRQAQKHIQWNTCEGEFGHPFDILRTAYRCEGPFHRKSVHCALSHIPQKLTADASRVIFIIMNPTRT
jgi:hypothetical protein